MDLKYISGVDFKPPQCGAWHRLVEEKFGKEGFDFALKIFEKA